MKPTRPAFITDDHGLRRAAGSVDGCGTGALTLAITVLALLALLLPGAVQAQSEWDGSSIALTGRCLPDGTAEFTVINNGRDMAGPAPWRGYEADIENDCRYVPACQRTNPGLDVCQQRRAGALRSRAAARPSGQQRPQAHADLRTHDHGRAREFKATSGRLLAAVCQKGVVVDFIAAPGGHVVYVVHEGLAFARLLLTTRHFRLTQRVKVCAGIVK